MGCWDPTPVTMAKLRARIDRDPEPLKQLARRLEKHGEFTLEGQMYKRPKGDPGRLLYPWYNRRQISLTSDHNCDGLYFSPQLADQVVNGFTFLMPYYDYLVLRHGRPGPGAALNHMGKTGLWAAAQRRFCNLSGHFTAVLNLSGFRTKTT